MFSGSERRWLCVSFWELFLIGFIVGFYMTYRKDDSE